MATFVVFDEFLKYMGDGVINFSSHTFKAGLTNTAPSKTNDTVWANITEIAAGNGYTAGGSSMTSVAYSETGAGTGIFRFNMADFSWTASGGSIGPLRYVVIYDDTPTSPADPLVGYWDYGSNITITSGNTFTIDIQTNGVVQVSSS